MGIEQALEGYLKELDAKVMATLSDIKLPKEEKNPIIKKLSDQKKATLEYQKQLQIIEMNTYMPHCGVS